MLGEERHFFRGPAAFGADGYGVGDSRTHVREFGSFDRLRAGGGTPGFAALQCGSEGGGLFGFAEEDTCRGVFLFEGLLEGDGVGDLGDVGAARLLGGFEGYTAPAFGTLESGLGQVFFGSAGEDWRDACDAEFSGLFDGPLHAVELEYGQKEMEGKAGVGG